MNSSVVYYPDFTATAPSPTVLTEGEDTVDRTTYTSASVTPTANRLQTLFISVGQTTIPTITSVVGNSLTWVSVIEVIAAAGTNRRMAIYRALGSAPTAGTIAINLSATASNCAWRLVEWSNVNIAGSNGAGAILQTASNTGSGVSKSVTLGSAITAYSVTVGSLNGNSSSDTPVIGTGFVELGDGENTNPGTPSTRLVNQWGSTGTNPIVATGGGGVTWEALAIEIGRFRTPAESFPQLMYVPSLDE